MSRKSKCDAAAEPTCPAPNHNGKSFGQFARWASRAMGHPVSFLLAVTTVVVWALTGPAFQFSETWQLVINTGTTIITFLMVFLIQSTQNRDSAAVQIKLDELIRSIKGASNSLLDLENLEERDLDELRKQYEKMAENARNALDERRRDSASKGE